MIKRLSLPTVAAVLLVGSISCGPDGEEADRFRLRFEGLDADKDGRLTAQELKGPLFEELDADRDGFVVLEETIQGLLGKVLPERPPADALAEGEHALWSEILQPSDEGQVREVAPPKPVAQGPRILKPGDVGVGRQLPDLEFTSLDGRSRRLAELARERNGVVLAFTSTTCPVSKRFSTTLSRLEASLEKAGIVMVLVNPFASEAPDAIRADIAAHGFRSPYVHDADESLALALDARTTTEVFLVDSTRTLIYRGALDDSYGIGYQRDEPRERYLADAVEAMLTGRRAAIGATEAPGCELDLPSRRSGSDLTDVTYHRDIARIVQRNCLECHHEGGIAPFALGDFAEVEDRARTIRRVIADGTMPPWFAHTDPDADSPWANDRSLSQQDRADLLAWIDSEDRPLGNPADAPQRMAFSDEGWQIGEPDLVVSRPRAMAIKADGAMPYVRFAVPTGLTEDRWVQAVELLPSAREVVHHAVVWAIDPEGSEVKTRAIQGYFALYVPGSSTRTFPTGYGVKLSKGATLHFQVHYTPNGTATEDQIRVGIRFADEPPEYQVEVTSLTNLDISIPAGAGHHHESSDQVLGADITVLGFLPHMHLRGKAFRYQVIGAAGPETLLDIPRYDFNWQLSYRLKEPLQLSAGTRLHADAWYDNSRENPANPDPTQRVRWGRQADDEMLIGYIEYFVPVER